MLGSHVSEQQVGHQGLSLRDELFDLLRGDAAHLVLGVFEDDFVLVPAQQEAGQDATVVGFDEVRDVLGFDQLRRFEEALQQLSSRQFLADRGQLRPDLFAFLLNAVAGLAGDAGGLEEDSFATLLIAGE